MSDEISEQHTIASTRRIETEVEAAPFRSRWVDALGGDSAVLGELAADCCPPAYAWLRASGNSPEEAAQRTHEFPTWLQLSAPPKPDAEDFMRFSDFLLNRLGAYAAAGFPPVAPAVAVSIDLARAERKHAAEAGRQPAEAFARRWSMMILEWTLRTLRTELEAESKGAHFTHFKPFLNFSGNSDELYAEIGPRVNLSASAMRLAVFRFRQRYRELLRHWIGDTVRAASDVDGELTMLLCAAS